MGISGEESMVGSRVGVEAGSLRNQKGQIFC
jgi:hypothetical protein